MNETTRNLALDIAGRIHSLGRISVTRFFGGSALVAAGVQFGFVVKGTFYLRVDDASRPKFEALRMTPFSYASREKMVTVTGYYTVPDDVLEDSEQLSEWAADAYRAARR